MFCRNCGTPMSSEYNFCKNCGFKNDYSLKENNNSLLDITNGPSEVQTETLNNVNNGIIDDLAAVKDLDDDSTDNDDEFRVRDESDISAISDESTQLLLSDVATVTTKKFNPVKVIWFSLVVLCLLLAGGGVFYFNKISSPEQVLADFAIYMEKGDYDKAFNKLGIISRHQAAEPLTDKENFVEWQNILDDKYGAIEEVEIKETTIFDRGYKSGQATGSSLIKLKRGSHTDNINVRLTSSLKYRVIPDWKLAFPTEVLNLAYLDIPFNTDIYIDGIKIGSYEEEKVEKYKVETFAGKHLITFKIDIAEALEIFPQDYLDNLNHYDFKIKDEEREAIENVLQEITAGRVQAWNSLGQETIGLQELSSSAAYANYATTVKDEIDSFLSYVDYSGSELISYNCQMKSLEFEDLIVKGENLVEVVVHENLSITAKYKEPYYYPYYYYGADEYYEDVVEGESEDSITYLLIKAEGGWKIKDSY